MTGCAIIAEVSIEAMAQPQTALYLCQASAVGAPVAAPKICAASMGYNRLLQDPAFKAANKRAAEMGCMIAVEAGDSVYRIILVKGARTVNDVEKASHHSKRTFRALNTQAGIQWMMRQLTSR